MNCAACLKSIRGADYLECGRCILKYHTTCVNTPAVIDWVCPMCISKTPKGDNNNKIIRPATPTDPNTSNVNTSSRKKRFICDVDNSPPTIVSITPDDIRAIIREELKAQDNRLSKVIEDLSSQLSDFKSSMDYLNEQFEKLRTDNIAHQDSITKLKEENEVLRGTVLHLETRMNQLDQLSRASNVEIQCVPENKAENLVKLIQQVGHVINCPVSDQDIHYCSRVAKVSSQSARPRNVLVKFSHPRLRDTFLAAVIAYNKKHGDEKLNTSHLGIGGAKSSIYIVENLSPENKSLHAAARLRAKELSYKFVWVRSGRIFMRKSETSGYVYVRNMDTLSKLE